MSTYGQPHLPIGSIVRKVGDAMNHYIVMRQEGDSVALTPFPFVDPGKIHGFMVNLANINLILDHPGWVNKDTFCLGDLVYPHFSMQGLKRNHAYIIRSVTVQAFSLAEKESGHLVGWYACWPFRLESRGVIHQSLTAKSEGALPNKELDLFRSDLIGWATEQLSAIGITGPHDKRITPWVEMLKKLGMTVTIKPETKWVANVSQESQS